MRLPLAAWWTLLALLTFVNPAAAECTLGPLTPIAGVEPHRERTGDDLAGGHLAVLLEGDGAGARPARIVDLTDPRRSIDVDGAARLAVVTERRAIAIAPGPGGKIFASALPSRTPARLVPSTGPELDALLDAVDGAGGESFVLLRALRGDALPGLRVHRLDAAGALAAPTLITPGEVIRARITRLADGRIAVAYLSFAGGERYGVSSLAVQWLDAKGTKSGQPIRLDGVRGRQESGELALAPSGSGVVVAWDPIVGVPRRRGQAATAEVRAFHVEPGAAPRLTRRDPLSASVFATAEVGGATPRYLQAAWAGGAAVLTWVQSSAPDQVALFAAPAEGGPPQTVLTTWLGEPLLRSDGKSLVLAFWERNAYHHVRGALTCAPSTAAAPPKPLPPPPAPPSARPLGPADFAAAWKHATALATASPRGADTLAELRGLTAADRSAAEQRLTSDEGRARFTFDCVMAARDLDELDACRWTW